MLTIDAGGRALGVELARVIANAILSGLDQ